ncbi:cysteine-rich DPF motif domain-containing protein 1 isoform X2 [Colius striatus]|uniref:cysteine-rich DPF motif domain-containing protein 1 isoform X2 n=1 Tax=Colius striatus TaxID=57412 RepID=UPI002B1D91B0|nr:cysteine-rich DPF motif domain-containing protein 1 isoform X2 [Colius striatus]
MDAPKEIQPTGDFTCQLCGLTAPYTYYGHKPPNKGSIVLLEDAYVMKDPFTPDKDKFLILGSHCSLCSRSVCVGAIFSSVSADLLQSACNVHHSTKLIFSTVYWNVVCSTPKGFASPV